MKALEKRLALIEAEAMRRNQKTVYRVGPPPDGFDWLGYPIGSEPAEPVECPAGSGVDWLGFPINNIQRKT